MSFWGADRNWALAILFGAIIVGISAQVYRPKPQPPTVGRSAQAACENRAMASYGAQIRANSEAEIMRTENILPSLGKNATSADVDKAFATAKYENKMAANKLYSSLCAAYARCSPLDRFRAVFNACYETWTSDPDNDDPSDTDGEPYNPE